MPLRLREMIFREGEDEASDQTRRKRFCELAREEERRHAACDERENNDEIMSLNLTHQSQQDYREHAVERIQSVWQKRGPVRIVKECRVPRRLIQLRDRFVGPPQIPDVAESITFICEVVRRELMELRKRKQVETDEIEN